MFHKPENVIYKSNRQAILIIMGVLLGLLITMDLYITNQQFDDFFESSELHLQEELEMAASFSLEPLLKSDYVLIEEFFNKWANNHKAILRLEVISPNGFKLVDYHQQIESTRSISASYPIMFQNEKLLTLNVTEDISHTYNSVVSSTIQLIGISIFLIIAFSYLLWITLRKTAIKPLIKEIEERQQAEQSLNQKTKELEYSNSELEAYSYSIAHDLRTPLRSITSFSQLLKEEADNKLNDTEKDSLNRIIVSGKKMSVLINDILNLTTISRGKIDRKELNLSQIVDEQYNYLKASNCKNIDLFIESDMHCKGDYSLISNLVANLLSNACKYSVNNTIPKIQIGKKLKEGAEVFYISDQGVGINMNYASKLFKPFERLHTNLNIEGTGIGLAICKRIVNRHNGEIWIESSEQNGTTVFFTIPDL